MNRWRLLDCWKTAHPQSPTGTSRGYRWFQRIVVTTILLISSAVIAMVAVSVRRAIRAEENLHATIFMVRLVEQFVVDNDRWPASWSELEKTRFPADAPSPLNNETSVNRVGGTQGYDWPADAQHLQERVSIDFSAGMDTLVTQEPMEFTAIRPIGPSYEYRDYGFVQSLQETLRRETELHPVATEGLVD